jgi:hypothetical protein
MSTENVSVRPHCMWLWSVPVIGKLQPAGLTRPPERFYPAHNMIPNLMNEKKKN